MKGLLIWGGLAIALIVPLIAAGFSEQLAWRSPVYIGAGFAGITAMALLLLQPLLAGSFLPGLSARSALKVHRIIGSLLVASIIVHVIGLYITSAPDVIDALLFRSPTPFSLWGVIAMWTVFGTAILALLKRKLRIRPRVWRFSHMVLAIITIAGSIAHALLIEGTMETVSKIALCVLVGGVTAKLAYDLKLWTVVAKTGR